MHLFLRTLSRSKGLQQSIVSMGGTFFALGISAVTVILVSRILQPSDFGVFSLVFAMSAILTKVGDVGFNFAFHKFVPGAGKGAGLQVIRELTTMRVLWLLLISCGLLILSPLITEVFKLPFWWMFAGSVVFAAISVSIEHLMSLFQSRENFLLSSGVLAGQSILKLLIVLLLIWLNTVDVISVTIGYFSVPVIISILFLPTWSKIIAFQKFSLRNNPYFTFIKHNGFQVLSTALSENIDIILLQVFLGVYATGIFGGISRIALLVSAIALSFGNVLNVRVSHYTKSSDRKAYLKKVALIVVGLFGSWVVSALLSRYLIIFTIGEEYVVARWELIVLLASAFLYFVSVPLVALFYSTNKPSFFSISGLLLIGSLLVSDFVLIPQFGVMGAAWARVISRGVVVGYTVWEVKKVIGSK